MKNIVLRLYYIIGDDYMKKTLLLLIILLFPVSIVSAQDYEITMEEYMLVTMNRHMDSMHFNFNEDTKTYSWVLNTSTSNDLYGYILSGDNKNLDWLNLRNEVIGGASATSEKLGGDYTFELRSGTNVDYVFFSFKDGEVLIDRFVDEPLVSQETLDNHNKAIDSTDGAYEEWFNSVTNGDPEKMKEVMEDNNNVQDALNSQFGDK